MLAFILRRAIQAIGVMIAVGIISFSMFRFAGDPVNQIVSIDTSAAERAEIRKSLGLDDPVLVQFAHYFANAAQFKFGVSYQFRQPVADLLKERMPATLELAVCATIFSLVSGILMGVVAGVLFALNDAHVKHAEESTNELLSFEMQMLGLFVIFLVMTILRIWFDLAEADIVLNDQRAVRKSIGTAFLHTFRGLGRLLASYILTTAVAGIILVGGLWSWMKLVPPESVGRAFLISQFILLLLLIARFWQRGVVRGDATLFPLAGRPVRFFGVIDA